MLRREKEAGVLGGGGGGEVLGLSNPSFSVKGKDLRRAAVRYVGLPDAAEDATKVKDAFAAFVGRGQLYTGASVTSKTLTCEFVCGELMACAAGVGLSFPAILASMGQFFVDMRAGDEDLRGFFRHLAEPGTAS